MWLESRSSSDAEGARSLLEQARIKLRPPKIDDPSLPALAAAAFFAVTALGFAAASVLAPTETAGHATHQGLR